MGHEPATKHGLDFGDGVFDGGDPRIIEDRRLRRGTLWRRIRLPRRTIAIARHFPRAGEQSGEVGLRLGFGVRRQVALNGVLLVVIIIFAGAGDDLDSAIDPAR